MCISIYNIYAFIYRLVVLTCFVYGLYKFEFSMQYSGKTTTPPS